MPTPTPVASDKPYRDPHTALVMGHLVFPILRMVERINKSGPEGQQARDLWDSLRPEYVGLDFLTFDAIMDYLVADNQVRRKHNRPNIYLPIDKTPRKSTTCPKCNTGTMVSQSGSIPECDHCGYYNYGCNK